MLKPTIIWVTHSKNRLDEAKESYQKAIELKPKSPSIYFNLAVTLNKLKRFDEAETSYRKVIELKPDYADAYLNLGNYLKISKSSKM